MDEKRGKKRWDEKSISIIRSNFSERSLRKETISGVEIMDVISKNACLAGRKVDQVRAFLQWDARNCKRETSSISNKKSSSPCSSVKRNTIPNTIYVCFENFIDEKKVPSLVECTQAYAKSPSLMKYKPVEIQNLVQKAINYDCELG